MNLVQFRTLGRVVTVCPGWKTPNHCKWNYIYIYTYRLLFGNSDHLHGDSSDFIYEIHLILYNGNLIEMMKHFKLCCFIRLPQSEASDKFQLDIAVSMQWNSVYFIDPCIFSTFLAYHQPVHTYNNHAYALSIIFYFCLASFDRNWSFWIFK